jgi:AraC-like DNA-binding protein
MSEFASAAMFRVLVSGMHRLGIQAPLLTHSKSARIPLEAKQNLLLGVQRQLGMEALLWLGQGVKDQLDDSLFPILIHPGRPFDVLDAWLRLERYIHSKHRIEQEIRGPNQVRHAHVSISKASRPSAQEDLVVLGVIVALLEQSGCTAVSATLADGLKVWPIDETAGTLGQLFTSSQSGSTRSWSISWGRQDDQSKLVALPGKVTQVDPMESSTVIIGDTVTFEKKVRACLDRMDGQASTIGQISQILKTSPRTLQRRLIEEGQTFADIAGNHRAQQAARLLAFSKASLAHIGFATGYSDQAHFSRDFLRRVGLRPQQYRDHSRHNEAALKDK